MFTVAKDGKVKLSSSLATPSLDLISSFHLACSTTTSKILIAITHDHSIYVWSISAVDDTIELLSQGRLDISADSTAALSPLPTSVASDSTLAPPQIRVVAIDESGKITFWRLEDAEGSNTPVASIAKMESVPQMQWKEEMSVRTSRTGVRLLKSNADYVTAIGEHSPSLDD